jgi:chaperone BCS1
VERQREKSQGFGQMGNIPLETLTLTAFTRDKDIIYSLLDDARKEALKDQEGKTVIYTSWGQEWKQFGFPRRKRPLNSVVLDKGISEKLESDVIEFLKNGKWYIDRGIPYRRGYLLYGPPGSGKSSFIQALAGELDYNICVLNLAEKYLSDDRFSLLLNSVPQRSIILLEDIDSAFKHRDKQEEHNSLTFSGFLNALDGVVSGEGRIIFMTTNVISALDPALIRPGRVDVKQFIGNVSPYQIKKMFLRFYEADETMADRFVAAVGKDELSAAQLQGHFLFYKKGPSEALENVLQLKN